MRVSELSSQSEVPIPTIKFYLREGLLPAGTMTGATQAIYDHSHLERLRVIRVLRDVGQLSVTAIRDVLAAIDDPDLALPEVLELAHHALNPPPPRATTEHDEARRLVETFVAGLEWRVDPASPALDALAGALVALQQTVGPCGPDVFTPYAQAAEQIARFELSTVDPRQSAESAVAQIVVGTVIFERALIALRHLGEEHFSRERFGQPSDR